MFECVNQAAVHEELEDETRRLCDVRPFLPVFRLVTRNCGRAERLLDSKIGVIIGKGKATPQLWEICFFCFPADVCLTCSMKTPQSESPALPSSNNYLKMLS